MAGRVYIEPANEAQVEDGGGVEDGAPSNTAEGRGGRVGVWW